MGMEEECTKGYFPWNQVSKEGLVFDKEVMDGGTYYNEERESLDENSNYQHRLAEDLGSRIKEIYENIAQDEGIEFPDYLTNFENCELRAVMCCFVQDRQANDNNGNCATPYMNNVWMQILQIIPIFVIMTMQIHQLQVVLQVVFQFLTGTRVILIVMALLGQMMYWTEQLD